MVVWSSYVVLCVAKLYFTLLQLTYSAKLAFHLKLEYCLGKLITGTSIRKYKEFIKLELQWRRAPPCSSWDTDSVAPFG